MIRLTIINLLLTLFLLLSNTYIINAQQIDNNSDTLYRLQLRHLINPKSYYKPPDLFLLDPSSNLERIPYFLSISQKETNWEKSRDLASSWGILNIKTDSKALNELLALEFEMAYGAYDEVDYLQGFREYSPHMYNFNVKGEFMDFEYGASYRSYDAEYERLQIKGLTKNKAGKELWISKKFGFLKLKSFISDYVDNVEFDYNRPRVMRNQFGSAIEINIQNLPVLNFSYTRGIARTISKQNDHYESTDNFNLYIYYWKPKWDIGLSTDLYLANDKEQLQSESKIETLELSGSLRPLETININPTFGIMYEEYDWLGGGINYFTNYASIALSYYPISGPLGLTLYGYYSNYKGSDAYTDTSIFNWFSVITLNLGKNFLGDQTLSVEFGYFGYLDNVFSLYNYHEFSSFLQYKVAMF